jgi:hypothetical protein
MTPIATPTIEMIVMIEMNASERLLQRYRNAIFFEKAHEVIVGTITTSYRYVNDWGRAYPEIP